MTIRQRILSYLQNHSEGIDDDELTSALSLSARQQANSRCRELEKEGLVIRRQVNGKIHNFWAGKDVVVTSSAPGNTEKFSDSLPKYTHWYWEGNVQSKVISFLAAQGYHIRSVANTASHQQGIDIMAEKDGEPLWVSVKGYPEGTQKTNPSLQAGHWFKQAIFDMVEYRERDKNVSLAIALPNFPCYRSMARRITWLKPASNFSYFWVNEDGTVIIE